METYNGTGGPQCWQILEGGETSSPKSCEMEILCRGPMLLLGVKGVNDDYKEQPVAVNLK
jgi:hypothetical protein